MILYLILSFIVGSAVGSFLNVVIDRATRGQSILGRSYCDYCKATLSTIDLVPVISFVALGGRCRYCHRMLSRQYPAVETAAGLLFGLSFYVLAIQGHLNLITLLFYDFLVAILIIVAVVDLKFSLIPTSFVFSASLISLFYNFFLLSPSVFIEHVLAAFGLAAFFLVIVLVTRGRGMGEGDIVLAFLMGMVLGVKSGLVSLFLAFTIGAVVALILIFLGKKRFGQTVPFAPFLVLGFLIALFWGSSIASWYLMLY